MKKLILPVILLISCTSCFRRFTMTKKEIRLHYKGASHPPSFFTLCNDSVRLFCASTGADTLPPLFLIHGAPGGWFSYLNLLDDTILQKHFHLISVDRLGYGRSRFAGKRKAETYLELQATAIHEIWQLDHSSKKAILLGSSYGAPIAATLALKYPEQCRYLVMLAPAIDPEKEKFWWFNPYARSWLMQIFLPHFINQATLEKYAHVSELKKLLPAWKNLAVPVTVVQGGADQIVDPENMTFAKRQLDGKSAEFLFLPGAGHLIRREQPEVLHNLLLRIAQQEERK